MDSSTVESNSIKGNWILDSGATRHMENNTKHMTDLHGTENSVEMKNGTTVQIQKSNYLRTEFNRGWRHKDGGDQECFIRPGVHNELTIANLSTGKKRGGDI